MGILFTNLKFPSIRSESVPRSGPRASTYSYNEKKEHLWDIELLTLAICIRHAVGENLSLPTSKETHDPCLSKRGLNTPSRCILQCKISPSFESIEKSVFSKLELSLEAQKIKRAKCFDSCQPARSAKADMCRCFSQIH